MAKNNRNKLADASAQEAGTVQDWNREAARIEAAAKEKAGSRGDALAKAGKAAAADTPAGKLIREACGDAGGQALIEQPRNVLVKIPRLAVHIASGEPWCSAAGLLPDARRKEDASVPVALVNLGAGEARQKANVQAALARYPGGANAQMPAALEALAFMGVVERKPGGKRNAEYAIKRPAVANKLIPA